MSNLLNFQVERGPETARVLIVGDSPTKKELGKGLCFSGDQAVWLAQELNAVGLGFKECKAAYCLDFYPPSGKSQNLFYTKTAAKKDPNIMYINGAYISKRTAACAKRLWETIDRVKPDRILALGEISLWMLTGNRSIYNWRGSMLKFERPWGSVDLLPTLSVAAVMRQKEMLRVFRNDLERFTSFKSSFDMPSFNIVLEPSANQTLSYLKELELRLNVEPVNFAVDIETRGGWISVCGIALSKRDAFVIPFTSVDKPNFYTPEEEFKIVRALETVLTHPNAKVSGQNYHYDAQYFAKLYGVESHATYDTMHMAHTLWTKGLPLGLSFLASLFCDWYRYWKEDGKNFHESINRREDEVTYWLYNGYDCCYTFEIQEKLQPAVEAPDFKEPYEFQQTMWPHVLETMNRGVRFDKQKQQAMRQELGQQIEQYRLWFRSLPITELFVLKKNEAEWFDSNHKLKKYFYEILGMEPIKKRGANGYRPTTDQAALKALGKREPVLALVCQRLIEYSSLEQFYNLYLKAKPASDGRMRSSYGLAGTDTFRLSSSGDPFGTGMNLQNLSKGG